MQYIYFMQAGKPYALRFNEDDVKAIDYLRERLGVEVVQLVRIGLRRLVQMEKAAENLEARGKRP